MSDGGKKAYLMVPHSSLYVTYWLNLICNVKFKKKEKKTVQWYFIYRCTQHINREKGMLTIEEIYTIHRFFPHRL